MATETETMELAPSTPIDDIENDAAGQFESLSYDAKVHNEARFDAKIKRMQEMQRHTEALMTGMVEKWKQEVTTGFKFQVSLHTIAEVDFKGEPPTPAAMRSLIAQLRLMEQALKAEAKA